MKEQVVAEYDRLVDERRKLLGQMDKIEASVCESCKVKNSSMTIKQACEGCATYEKLRTIGDKLTVNLNETRMLRQEKQKVVPTLVQKATEKTKQKNHIAIQELRKGRESVAKVDELSVEEYKDLVAQGKRDKDIMEIWGIGHNLMNKFKKQHGLVGERGKYVRQSPEQPKQEDKAPEAQVSEGNSSSYELRLKELEEKFEYATKYIEELIAKNEQLNKEIWGSRLSVLYLKQQELDKLVEQTHDLKLTDYKDEHLLGLLSEIIETANEHQGFKYWKVDNDIDREELLEEAADILHFLVSRGNVTGERLTTLEVTKKENLTKQFLTLIEAVVLLPHGNELYQEAFNLYAGLVEMLGFTWEEIELAYNQKHSKNIARQQSGY